MIKVARYLKTPTLSPLRSLFEVSRTTIARRLHSTAETAHYGRFGSTKLCRLPQWMLIRPPRRGYGSGRRFRDVVAASLGDATHAVLFVLVLAIRIALDNGNGDDEARTYSYT